MPSPAPVPLSALGLDPARTAELEALAPPGGVPGRVARVDRGLVTVLTATGSVRASTANRLRTQLGGAPLAVGDWVVLRDGVAVAVGDRRTALRRLRAGAQGADTATVEQVVAVNVDVVFVVAPLGRETRLRRLERSLAVVWSSGAVPVVVLTKADLVEDPVAETAAFADSALTVDVIAVAVTADRDGAPGSAAADVEALVRHTRPDRTVALLGPSGAGKSTLVNALVGEERLAVQAVRTADGRGRHTTTHRELVPLPGGGVLIDTPGVRELGLWDAEEGIDAAFADVEALSAACRFADCRHDGEPGCAVEVAVESGRLDGERLESWRKLQREQRWLEVRQDARARSEQRRETRVQSKALRRWYDDR